VSIISKDFCYWPLRQRRCTVVDFFVKRRRRPSSLFTIIVVLYNDAEDDNDGRDRRIYHLHHCVPGSAGTASSGTVRYGIV